MTYYGPKDLAESFRTVRKNTIQVAEDIPEDKYSYRAVPDTMSIAELLAHVATSTHWATQLHFAEKKSDVAMDDFGRWMGAAGAQAKELTSKAAIVAALKANGDAFAKGLEGMAETQLGESVTLPNGSKSRFEMMLGVKEHEMHHRAQLFLLQRMVGIIPHLTRARMEMMKQREAAAKA